MMLSDVCLTSVEYIRSAGGVCGRPAGAYWLIGPSSAGLAEGCRCALPLQAWTGAYRGSRPPIQLVKQAVRPVVGPTQYAAAHTSGDLNSHPELSGWRSQYTNRSLDINVPVKHTSCEFSRTRQVFDLLTSKWGHLCHGFPSCQYIYSTLFAHNMQHKIL